MGDIIKTWNLTDSDKKPWLDAAKQFRLPYWDWARKQSYTQNFALPQLLTWEVVSIIKQDGKIDSSYPNPLWGFQNPMGDFPMGDKRMGNWAIGDNPLKPDPKVTPLPVCMSFTY